MIEERDGTLVNFPHFFLQCDVSSDMLLPK